MIARGQGWEVGKMSEGRQMVQTSSYKMNKFWEWNVHHGDYS